MHVYPVFLSMFKEQSKQTNDNVEKNLLVRLTPLQLPGAITSDFSDTQIVS